MRLWQEYKRSTVYSCEAHVRETRHVVQSTVCGLRSAQKGFTLIELLVAMAILMIIVLMLANLFQQSTRAWDAGMRQTESGLKARSEIHMIQQALSGAIYTNNAFYVLDENGSLQITRPWTNSPSFGAPALVSGYDNLFELSWDSPGATFRVSSVRVFSVSPEAEDVDTQIP